MKNLMRNLYLLTIMGMFASLAVVAALPKYRQIYEIQDVYGKPLAFRSGSTIFFEAILTEGQTNYIISAGDSLGAEFRYKFNKEATTWLTVVGTADSGTNTMNWTIPSTNFPVGNKKLQYELRLTNATVTVVVGAGDLEIK